MRYSFLALAGAAFAALSNAYTQPVGPNPVGNPFSKPGLGEIVPAGIPYTITWNPTTTGTVTLVLLRGPSTNVLPLYSIVEGIPNTGSYVWTPSTSLQADVTHYGIQLIVDATGQYQYTAQFGISNSGTGSSSASSSAPLPTSSSTSTSTSTSNAGYTIPAQISSAPYVYRYNTSNSTGYTIPASTGFVPSTAVLPTTPKTVGSTPVPTKPATVTSGVPTNGAGKMIAAPAMLALAGLAVLFV